MMDELWRKMREIEETMSKLHQSMLSDFDRLFKAFDSQKLPPEKEQQNIKTFYVKFYAKREIDSHGKNLQEAYLDVNGDKKYWKKDGDNEILMEPNKKGNEYLEKMWRKFLPHWKDKI